MVGAKSIWPTWATNLAVIFVSGIIGLIALQSLRYVDHKKQAKSERPAVPSRRAHVVVTKIEFSPLGPKGFVNVWHRNDGDLDAQIKGSVSVIFPKPPKDAKELEEMTDTFFNQMLQAKPWEGAPKLSMPPHTDPQFVSAPTIPPKPELMPQILNGELLVIVLGRFAYTDETQVEHHTDYCAFVQKNVHPVFYCQQHNEAP